MIKKQGKKWKVVSKTGKNLGSGYNNKADARKRLAQVEWFKAHQKGKK